jgi:hypothetical protein
MPYPKAVVSSGRFNFGDWERFAVAIDSEPVSGSIRNSRRRRGIVIAK